MKTYETIRFYDTIKKNKRIKKGFKYNMDDFYLILILFTVCEPTVIQNKYVLEKICLPTKWYYIFNTNYG